MLRLLPLASCLLLISACSGASPPPRVAPPSELTKPLAPPPEFTARDVPGLVADDALRMKLLGICVVDNNTKAKWISLLYK